MKRIYKRLFAHFMKSLTPVFGPQEENECVQNYAQTISSLSSAVVWACD